MAKVQKVNITITYNKGWLKDPSMPYNNEIIDFEN